MLYVNWLIKADRLLKQAAEREAIADNGIQYVSFWGQTKHWSEWRRIWEIEKLMLIKKYAASRQSTTSKLTHPRKD